jgi:hypothetical protein
VSPVAAIFCERPFYWSGGKNGRGATAHYSGEAASPPQERTTPLAVCKCALRDFAVATVYVGKAHKVRFQHKIVEMKSSKILLFAARTIHEGAAEMAQSDEKRLALQRMKMAQLKAREQAILARKKETDRKADTRRKVIIGGIWLKYFPDCKNLNPADEQNFSAIANAIATLAYNEQFLHLWMDIQEKMRQ